MTLAKFKGSVQEERKGVTKINVGNFEYSKWDTGDRGLFVFYFAVVFSSTYFRFGQVQRNYYAISISLCNAHRTVTSTLKCANTNGATISPALLVMAH